MSHRNYHTMSGAGPSNAQEKMEEGDMDEDLPQCKIKRNYACAQCDFFTQNPRTYLYHLRDTHQARIKVYECPQCVYASKHSQKLQRHIHMVHVLGQQRQQQQQQMQMMRKASPPNLNIIQPRQELYEEEEESDIDVPMEEDCMEMDGMEMEDVSLDDEAAAAEDGRQHEIQCSQCPFKSSSVTLVRRHEQIAHLKKKFFRCNKCNYVTHLKARFTKHVKYHSMPMIKCDLCDFRTPYKWNLDRHYRNHQGDGEFKCPLCNFRADIKQSLTVHVQNHHLTPQQKALRGVNRRNKVGGSDAPSTELRMSDVGLIGTNPNPYSEGEEEDFENSADLEFSESPTPSTSAPIKKNPPPAPMPKLKQQSQQKSFTASDFVHPDDVLHKNGKVYHRSLKCRFCQYKAFFAGDLARHEAKRHGAAMPVPQAKKRPMPNLIPLQHASPPPSDADIMAANILSGGHSIFGGPSIIAQSDDEQESFNRKVEFEDEDMEEEETPETLDKMDVKVEHEEPQELKCNLCGHDSKTINEALNHQKTHKNEEAAQRSFLEGVGLSSTRCQHCGVRCKNSAELMVHLRKCTSKARGSDAGALDSGADNQKSSDDHSDEEIVGLQCASCRQPFEEFEELRNHIENCKARMMELTPEVSITEIKGAEFMPVVAKNFNWNHDKSPQRSASKEIKPALTIERVSAQNLNSEEEDKIDTDEDDMEPRKLTLGEVFVGIETAPGYGCVTEEKVPNPHESQIQFTKVYKCPQCNFWASAASRFHIHFVGHLNSKPFGCSQCNYRSNWRWDVAKHIRLKGARDPKHAPGARPRVLVTDDDTSRRNYSKYAKYIMYLLVQPGPDMEGLPNSVSSRISPNSVKQQMPVLQSQVPSRPTVSRTPTESAMQQFERSMQPETSQAKQPNRLLQNKKLVWRCKKCNHRGMNKEEVLDHVRSHYTNPKQQQQHEPVTAKKFSCEKCPFTGKMNEVQLHKSHHQPQPGANFKCYICPFFVSNKKELYTHMSVHGVSDPEEFMNKMQSGTFSLSVASAPSQKETKPPKVPDTSNMKEVPLFWVTKGGKFMKKFKCRHCPHNNSRKVNIVEHEKMHTNRQVWGATDYSNVYHTCTHCNYTCNNAGVLSAHFKVHQDSYPKALTLVDPSRPDIDQVRELGGNEHSLDNQGSLDSREGSPAAQSESKTGLVSSGKNCKQPFLADDNGDVNSPSGVQVNPEKMESDEQLVYFCSQCPGRFMFTRELAIHKRFHRVKLQFHCSHCNYTARQPQHLAAHNKVHCSEYQDRTALLLMNHQESMDHPKPALIVRDDIWVVNELDDLGDMPILKHQHQVAQPQQQQETSPGQSQARQHCCHLCPARFFKAVALQYHVSLHGGNGPYKCSKCDYAVKMYGNLVRHEVVHDEKENEDLRDDPPNIVPATVQMASPPPVISRPMPQLQPQVPQPQPQVPQLQPQVPHISLPADPVFGTLMHGSPEFIYPTYMKNGKLKEKRYKCHKCPSAFEKREQYKVHLSLHGSKQKYKCERCDYSVKYYANFIQHTKKHDINDQAQQQKLQEQQQQMQEQYESQKPPELMDLGADEDDLDDETLKVLHEPEVVLVTKPNAGSLGSVQRQQQMMMLERRKQHQQSEIPTTPEMAVATTPTFWCSNCPYCNQRRDQVEQHLRLHQRQSDMKYACCYCDLANATQQDMQEHMLLHFRARKMPNSRRAVTFTSYDDMEIRASKLDQPDDEEEEEGAEGRLVVRKLSEAQPQPENSNDEDEQDCQFIDLRTGNAVPYEQEMLARKEQAAQLL